MRPLRDAPVRLLRLAAFDYPAPYLWTSFGLFSQGKRRGFSGACQWEGRSMSIFDLTAGQYDETHDRVEREIARLDRQREIPVVPKSREQIERELQNRLTRSIQASGRERLTLEQESAPESPQVRAIRAAKRGRLTSPARAGKPYGAKEDKMKTLKTPTKSARKMNALKALKGGGYGPDSGEAVIDLLTDLMHLAPIATRFESGNVLEFDDALEIARHRFEAEGGHKPAEGGR